MPFTTFTFGGDNKKKLNDKCEQKQLNDKCEQKTYWYCNDVKSHHYVTLLRPEHGPGIAEILQTVLK